VGRLPRHPRAPRSGDRRRGPPAHRLHPRRPSAQNHRRNHRTGGAMTPAELAAIAARGRADAGELAALLDALGADTKAVQRRAAEAVAALARPGQDGEERPRRDVEALRGTALAAPAPRRRWGAAYAWSRLGRVPSACLPVLLDALG